MRTPLVVLITIGLLASPAIGQTTSIRKRQVQAESSIQDREQRVQKGNPALERHSLIAVKPIEPKEFKVHDLITVIVREQTTYEAEASTNNKRQADVESELDSFVKFTDGGIGAALFRRGKPNISYKGQFNQKNDAENDREDKFTTRVTAEVLDVKPNGNLVIEASKELRHGDEVVVTTITGICRSLDVSPDNTVLSTQIAKQRITVIPMGTMRDSTKQGWLARAIDLLRPF